MKRSEASKINGAKSNGPVTEAGKAVSSKNAVKFGLSSADVLIPGEDPAEYDLLLGYLELQFGADTPFECDLCSALAAIRWRLRRIPKMEKAAHYAAAARVGSEPEHAKLSREDREMRVWQEVTNGPELKQVHRHETRLLRAWEKGRAELEATVAGRLAMEEAVEQYLAEEAELVDPEPSDDGLDDLRQNESEPLSPGPVPVPRHPMQNEPGARSRLPRREEPDAA